MQELERQSLSFHDEEGTYSLGCILGELSGQVFPMTDQDTAQPWPRLPIIHLQQSDRSGDHHWPFTRPYNAQGMVRAEAVLQAIEPWLVSGDVYLFLEPIHPFEAEDALVLDELKESVAYWREALLKY